MRENADRFLPTEEERKWAMFGHLSGLLYVLIPYVGGLGAAFAFWFWRKNTSAFVADQSREALNFHLVMAIVQVVNSALMLILVGWLFYAIVWVFMLVVIVLAAVRADKGVSYRYPLVPRLLR